MALLRLLLLLLPCLAAAYYSHRDDLAARAGAGVYDDDSLMQDLYKRLADIDPSYFQLDRQRDFAPVEEDYDPVPAGAWLDDEPGGLKSRPRSADIDPSYFQLDRQRDFAPVEEDYDPVPAGAWLDDESGGLKSRPRSAVAGGQTDTRDSEYIGHSSNAATNAGFIYMSGIYFASAAAVAVDSSLSSSSSLTFLEWPKQ